MGALYLQVRAGPLLVLFDATGVHEVLQTGWQGQVREHAQWRSQVLPVISLGAYFGFPEAYGNVGVVYSLGPSGSPLLFAADEVLGLRSVEAHEWKRLPALPARVERYFDAALAGAGQATLSYRLRVPLDSLDFGVTSDDIQIEVESAS